MRKSLPYVLILALIISCVVAANFGSGNVEIENQGQLHDEFGIGNQENKSDTIKQDTIQ